MSRWKRMPGLINCAMAAHHRNFEEVEGTVSPPNILNHPEWSDYVFISTIRLSLARIVSSLYNEPRYVKKGTKCTKSATRNQLNDCAHQAVASEESIMSNCHQSIYFCYSNNFVRMFAGHPNGSQNKVTREAFEAA